MDHSGMAVCLWRPCLLYVVFLLNHLALDTLVGGLTPIRVATDGQRPGIWPLIQFCWFKLVLYSVEHSFPSTDSPKKIGC
jgi:hypothetical protein